MLQGPSPVSLLKSFAFNPQQLINETMIKSFFQIIKSTLIFLIWISIILETNIQEKISNFDPKEVNSN